MHGDGLLCALHLRPAPSARERDAPLRARREPRKAREARGGVRRAMALEMPFPIARPRRLRQTAAIRALARETALDPGDFIYPLFFSATLNEPRPVTTMPGVSQLPVSAAAG